jgi:glycogen operon protein
VPPVTEGVRWRLFIDTAAEMPDDIYPDADGPPPEHEPMVLEAHSLRCYVGQ